METKALKASLGLQAGVCNLIAEFGALWAESVVEVKWVQWIVRSAVGQCSSPRENHCECIWPTCTLPNISQSLDTTSGAEDTYMGT